jgi:hypothetical protein
MHATRKWILNLTSFTRENPGGPKELQASRKCCRIGLAAAGKTTQQQIALTGGWSQASE